MKWFNDCVGLLFRSAEEYHSIHVAWLSTGCEALGVDGWLKPSNFSCYWRSNGFLERDLVASSVVGESLIKLA